MPQLLTPPSFKKKMLTTLVVVALGHAVTLWGISHMKAPELHKIEKEPLQVRFVKIKQEQALPPTPKAEPKTEPKPKEVKIVEQAPPPKPQKIEKVHQVKTETAKPVQRVVEKTETKVEPTIVTEVVTPPKPTPTPAPVVVEAPPQPAPAPVAPAAPTGPKSVSIGGSGVQWSRSPKPQYTSKDLQGEERRVVVEITADQTGKVTNARIVTSSGLAALDEKILRSVRSARFKPYKENGIAYPIKAEQPFDLTLNAKG